MSDWLNDEREIASVKLAGNATWYHRIAGSRFDRFERNGEYCMLPWIRVTDAQLRIWEAPLTQVEFLELRAVVRAKPDNECEEVR
jgi:hypothetical protein